jgi:sugar lactone lactonase YvrE
MKKPTQTVCRSLMGAVGAGAILLLTQGALAQNLFVSDYNNGTIYEDPSVGSQSVFYSGFDNLSGLASDSAGDLFVADQGTGKVYEFVDSGGILSTTPTLLDSGLSSPAGLAVDIAGDLFIANMGGNDIIEVMHGGGVSTYLSGLDAPQGLAFDTSGNLYVANSGANDVLQFTPGKVQSTYASGLNDPWGLAFNNVGDLFVGNLANKLNGQGSITEVTPGKVATPFVTGLSLPNELAFNSAGDLLVAQGESDNVLEFTTTAGSGPTITISGASNANGLAFQGVALPVPEPSTWALMSFGGAAVLRRLFRKRA